MYNLRNKPNEQSEETEKIKSEKLNSETIIIEKPKVKVKMEHVKQVNNLNLNGNLADNWKRFRKNFEIFLEAAGLSEENDSKKVAVLLNAIGEDGVELYETFALSKENKKKYNEVINAFEDFCIPKKRIVYERFLFFTRNQEENEPFDSFLMDIKRLSKTCDFGNQNDSLLRDRIVLGTNNRKLQEKMLEMEVTLEKAVELGKAAEITENQAREMQKRESVIHQVTTKARNNEEEFTRNKHGKNNGSEKISNKVDIKTYICSRCNRQHKRNECPAYGQKCFKCNKMNHFSSACLSKGVACIQKNVSNDNIFHINMIKSTNRNKWIIKLSVNNYEIEIKVDTGSDVNIISYFVFQKIAKNVTPTKTSVMLKAYGGQEIKPIGECYLWCQYKNKMSKEKFLIVQEDFCSVLGIESIENLEIIPEIGRIETKGVNEIDTVKKEFVNRNRDIFEGVGKFKGQYKITLMPNAQPIVNPPRRVPLKIIKPLKSALDELLEKGIISRVEEPRDWVHNLVIIEKSNGSLRLCLDPKNLNKYVKKEQYLIPTLDDILPKLNEAKYFTVLDLKEGFYQIELDKESRKLCTFATPFGSYQFNRLPFGLSTAPEIFQKKNEENFSDIPNVLTYIDDILIYGKDKIAHDETLEKVLSRARELNIKFNENKIQLEQGEIDYLGHRFTADGIYPSTERVNAIKSLNYPKSKKELQKFLGMINYVRSFIPNLAEITTPLRLLLKKNVIFKWEMIHSNCIDSIKNILTSPQVLKPFNEKMPIVIQTDASQNGIGCCLLQNGSPIAYASRSMSETEQRYAQVEKELLAIIYSCRKFHYFIYGREAVIKTDHMPLVALMEKEIHKIPSGKLQRMRIRLLNYRIKVEYLPGKFMFIADYLSRDSQKFKLTEEESVFHESILAISASEEKEKKK